MIKSNSRVYTPSKDYWSIVISIYIVLSTVIIFMLMSTEFFHWFIIPLILCGIIITIDAVDWIRKKLHVFDPVGFIGIFGFHFFFLAPLLQIYWNYGMSFVVPPDDWRPWLGGVAIINFIGLLIYKYTRKILLNRILRGKRKNTYWKINKRRLFYISAPLLVLMAILQIYIYISQGGILGYINAYVERTGAFEGSGWLFMISESFPIIGIILLAVFLRNTKYQKSYFILISIIISFFIVRMFFGGLRGSRSNTIWAMIWAVGIINFWLRPVTRKFIYIGLLFLFAFIYIYGIYKGAGFEVVNAIRSSEERAEIAEESGRGIQTVLLGDLARANVQAFIFYRLYSHPSEYELAFGRSYLGDLSILIPKSIWKDRPPTKVKEGTEIIVGTDNYHPDGYVSSRIYGLTGEFMLNFGFIFAPIAFIILGLFVAVVKSRLYIYQENDARLLIYPFLIVCCFLLLVQDLDNFTFGIVKNLLIPYLVVRFASDKVNDIGNGILRTRVKSVK